MPGHFKAIPLKQQLRGCEIHGLKKRVYSICSALIGYAATWLGGLMATRAKYNGEIRNHAYGKRQIQVENFSKYKIGR